jgi:hypothetical protein
MWYELPPGLKFLLFLSQSPANAKIIMVLLTYAAAGAGGAE